MACQFGVMYLPGPPPRPISRIGPAQARLDVIKDMRNQGCSMKQIAKHFGLSYDRARYLLALIDNRKQNESK